MKQGGGQNRSSTSVGVLELPFGSQRGLCFPGFYKPSSPAKNVIKANQINGPNAATCDGAMDNSTLPQLQQGPQQDAGALRTANMVCNHSCRSACACAPAGQPTGKAPREKSVDSQAAALLGAAKFPKRLNTCYSRFWWRAGWLRPAS